MGLINFPFPSEVHGKDVEAMIEQPLEEDRMHIGKNTVTYESRLLKALLYEIIGWNQ